jgi:hypothetical protein
MLFALRKKTFSLSGKNINPYRNKEPSPYVGFVILPYV